ncbi:MAG: helix-turn-helix domain-containing protein [Flavobacteriaceae bacterium]|nr:MAG: helix-turn-helix domain-containing protein [Flavobacteriaceae bacterium]
MEPTQALLLASIKRIRKEKGLTQKDVAEGCGMLVPTYSRLERGGSNPSLASIVRIAAALGVAVVELFQSSDIKDRSLAQKLEMINSLSETDRGIVEILIDTVLEKSRLEQLQDVKMKKRLAELERVRKS